MLIHSVNLSAKKCWGNRASENGIDDLEEFHHESDKP